MHLTELKLSYAYFDLASLERTRLVTILCVRKLDLSWIRFSENQGILGDTGFGPNGTTFCRIISSIFSNLEQLSLDFDNVVSMISLAKEAI